MTDVRESILLRLKAILEEVFVGYTVGRNLLDLPLETLPAVILMDGDEDASSSDSSRTRPSFRPYRVTMTPSIHAIFADDAELLGPAMNQFRVSLLGAVLDDPDLLALSLNDSGVSYDGTATGMFSEGEKIVAEIGVSLSIEYALKPGDL